MTTTQQAGPGSETEVGIQVGHVTLEATLYRPENPSALVLFSSGSGRRSARNVIVAEELQRGGLATLLVDLLTPREEREDRHSPGVRYDVEVLSERLIRAIDWAQHEPGLEILRVGVFGACTGGAAALAVAAARPYVVHAVVCRGTRTDFAASHLPFVKAPTLLIAGELDAPVIAVNEEAIEQMPCDAKLEVVPGASHLFEEPGVVNRAAEASREWFDRHLVRRWAE